MFLLRDLRLVLCSRDLDILRAQRIIGFFYRNYPQINEVNKSDHVVVHTPCARASCSASVSNPSLMNTIGPCSRA